MMSVLVKRENNKQECYSPTFNLVSVVYYMKLHGRRLLGNNGNDVSLSEKRLYNKQD